MRVAIIGSGIAGISLAYFLARSGIDVVVFEKRYPLYGASGRSSGGITLQFDKPEFVDLAKESLKIYDRVQSEVGFNFLYRHDGYIKVARNREDLEKLEKEVRVTKTKGVKAKIIEPEDVKEFVPDFNPDAIEGASYSEGGVIFPWPVIWGFAKGCKEMGVEIKKMSEVSEIIIEKGFVKGVKVNGEVYKADYVVNAAGAWSNEVSSLAGVGLDNRIIKEEVCVSESLKPYLDPYILDVSTGVYLSQSVRGEIVGGILGSEVEKPETSSTFEFLTKYAKRASELIPKLKGLTILRQWAGVYDVAKDEIPVVGLTSVSGFIQFNGLGKFGMCIAPALAKELAILIIRGENRKIEKFSPLRLKIHH